MEMDYLAYAMLKLHDGTTSYTLYQPWRHRDFLFKCSATAGATAALLWPPKYIHILWSERLNGEDSYFSVGLVICQSNSGAAMSKSQS